MSKLLSHFPAGFTPNSSQVQILRELDQAFTDGYKYIILIAPTGSGKSFISKTLSNASNAVSDGFKSLIESYDAYKQDQYGNYVYELDCLAEPAHGAFALTISKQLQDQYLSIFNDSTILKGKTNYVCKVDESLDVEAAPCIFSTTLKADCWNKNKCLYYNARNEMAISKFSVLNYSMFLSLPGHIKRRNYIICDEASELEEELTNRFGISLEYSKLQLAGLKVEKLRSDSPQSAKGWLMELNEKAEDIYEGLLEKADNKMLNLTLGERIRLKYLKNLINKITNVDGYWDSCEFVIDKTAEKVDMNPLNVDVLTKSIFDYGDKIVLMSATITNPKNFAKTLGIKDYKVISVDSTFNPKKSPIYVSTKTPLNYENLKKNLPIIAQQIQAICDHHKGEKGIIHTHTNEICQYLSNQLKGTRFLFRQDTLNNEKMLGEHFTSKEPTVLVSPSLTMGTDLHGDNGRFQIIVKTPFPPLSNKRIKKKFDTDKSWYTAKTLNNLVQMSGRCTRNIDDHSTTYILDGTVVRLIGDNKDIVPKHFIERIV